MYSKDLFMRMGEWENIHVNMLFLSDHKLDKDYPNSLTTKPAHTPSTHTHTLMEMWSYRGFDQVKVVVV